MKSKIGQNLILQTVYQILNTCLPLITAPYLARVLGATQLGVFSYTSSVIAYYSLFAMLGTVNYGTRSIASAGDDKELRSRLFWEIYILQICTTLISLFAYIVYLLFVCKDNHIVATVQILTLIGCLLDINWLFFGCENFKLTVTRSFVIRIITVAAIMLFVKSEDQLWLYTAIMLIGTIFSNSILWLYAFKHVSLFHIRIKGILSHIKPNLILFIPLLAMSVYHIMDRTMMGLLSDYTQCGYYYNADKVINIPLGILFGVGTVMLPRMTSLFSENKVQEANKLFLVSVEGIAVIGIAMTCGISAISNEFVPWFFGKGYDSCIVLIIVLSPVLLVKGLSNTVRTQYLVPLKKEAIFTKSVIIGAIVNLIVNLMFIPKLGAMGAVLGTLLAELVACIIQFFAIKGEIKFREVMIRSMIYLCFGMVMIGFVRCVSYIEVNIWIKLLVELGTGVIVYSGVCIVFWKKTNNSIYKDMFLPIIQKFFKRSV